MIRTRSEGKRRWRCSEKPLKLQRIDHYLSMKDLEALSKGGNADRFLDARITVCNRRSLFKTTTGLKGVGPQCLEEGDQIRVLYGATIPFDIRSDRTGGFLLVGECYVHNIMSGEVIQQLGNLRYGVEETWIPLS
jgi:hypothetical protein